MNNDEKLNQQLERPPVPDDLDDKIRANWSNQLAAESSTYLNKVMLASIFLLTFLPAIFVINAMQASPRIVTAALQDLNNDNHQNIGITVPITSLLSDAKIHAPPRLMPIVMSKFCIIEGNQTTHLKVAAGQKGYVHIYIPQQAFDLGLFASGSGIVDSMPWKIIKPRPGLSVLVIYSSEMSRDNVDTLLHTMFLA